MISAEQFIDVLEEKDLLPGEFIRILRRRVAESDKPVTAIALAKQLIKMGHLTPALGERLLAAPLLAQAASEPAEDDDDLGLAPLEEDPKQAKKEEAKEPAEEDELGLAPLEKDETKPAPKTPAAKPSQPKTRKPKPPEKLLPTQRKKIRQAPKEKPRPEPEQPSPGGGSLLDEELAALEDAAAAPLDDLMAGSPLEAAAGSPLDQAPRKKKLFGRKRPGGPKAKAWDSPVIIIGAGSLLVLLVLFGTLYWVLNRETGDKMLEPADEDYHSGAWTQAIHKYDDFLDRFPNHGGASLARVRRGVARLRQATQGKPDWSRALDTAREVLVEIADEPAFTEERGELASLLPEIARGLTDQAREAPDSALVDRANETLELIGVYVAKSQRNKVTLDDIRADLALATRELARDAELEKAIAAMREAIEAGKTAEAYRVRAALLKQYPGLIGNAKLGEAVLEVSRAQKEAVEVVEQQRQPETTDRATALVADVALAQPHVLKEASGAADRVVFALAGGVAYGLDAASGKVLWQRPLGSRSNGHTTRFAPTAISRAADSDVLTVDPDQNEVLRINALTGKLVWRQSIGQPFDAHPVATRDEVLVATHGQDEGRLVRINLESGATTGYVRLPQPVRVTPAVDSRRDSVYLVAEHSNLYVLSLADGHCKEVVYLGHQPGGITAAVVLVDRFLLLVDNDRLNSSTLRVFSVEPKDEGPAFQELQRIKLKGHVDTPLMQVERRLVLATDSGAIYVFEISAMKAEKPLNQIAEREAQGRRDLVRFSLLAGEQFWIAGDQLSRYDIQTARGRLTPKPIHDADQGSVFLQPVVNIGQTLFHVRYEIGRPGILVSAVEMSGGKRLWQTAVSTSLAVEPAVDSQSGNVACATSAGALFQFESSAVNGQAVLNEPVSAVNRREIRRPLQCALDLGDGLLAMTGGEGAERLFVFDPKRRDKPVPTLMLSGPLGCRPIAFDGKVLAPCSSGQVFLIDPRPGSTQVVPFQPPLKPGLRIPWRRPALIGQKEFVIADGRMNLYRVGIEQKPKPHLKALATVDLEEENKKLPGEDAFGAIISPAAVVGEAAYAVDEAGNLLRFALPDLKPATVASLGGRCTWGPRTLGGLLLVATDEDRLLLFGADGKLTGHIPLSHGPLAGTPIEIDGTYVLASAGGVVWRVKPPTADTPSAELGRIDVGRRLRFGPLPFDGKLLVVGEDGSLCIVALPGVKQPKR